MVEVIKRRKKPESIEPVIEIKGESTNSVEVEAKVEVKPAPQPKPPKQPKPQQPQQVIEDTSKKQFFFLRIGTDEEQGERLMFRMRSGEIVEGIIADEKSGFIKLADAVITDKESGTISKVKWIRMERTQIAHFSPLPTEIKMIEPVS